MVTEFACCSETAFMGELRTRALETTVRERERERVEEMNQEFDRDRAPGIDS